MKNVAKFLLCTFAFVSFYSCDPEDISAESDVVLDDVKSVTGNQEGDIIEQGELPEEQE